MDEHISLSDRLTLNVPPDWKPKMRKLAREEALSMSAWVRTRLLRAMESQEARTADTSAPAA